MALHTDVEWIHVVEDDHWCEMCADYRVPDSAAIKHVGITELVAFWRQAHEEQP